MSTTRRGLSRLAIGAALSAPGIARAQARACRFTLDWALGGTSAWAVVAQKNGYFAEEGVQVRVSRGFGSGRVPVDIAGGAYDMGFGDFNAMAKFASENPESGMMAVLMLFDGLPMVCISKADGPIRVPKDLEGKRIAAPEGDSGRQIFPVFAEAAGFDAKTVQWISVSPELREPMLVRGQTDAITGFITSASISLKGLGLALPQQNIMRYSQFGVPLYSNAVMTTRRFAEANPDVVRGVVRSLIRGMRSTVQQPDAAVAAVKEVEPLVDVALETERARLLIEELVMTDHVRRHGISSVDPKRMADSLTILERVYGFTRRPGVDLYTDAYLPPAAQRAMA